MCTMAKTKPTLAFQDTAPFDANLAIFAAYLAGLDADLAEAATPLLSGLSETAMKREEVLDNLMAALLAAEAKAASKASNPLAEDAPPSTSAVQDEPPAAPLKSVPAQIGWFLEQLEIEGFRGVNNEGAPLVPKFKPDAVSPAIAGRRLGLLAPAGRVTTDRVIGAVVAFLDQQVPDPRQSQTVPPGPRLVLRQKLHKPITHRPDLRKRLRRPLLAERAFLRPDRLAHDRPRQSQIPTDRLDRLARRILTANPHHCLHHQHPDLDRPVEPSRRA